MSSAQSRAPRVMLTLACALQSTYHLFVTEGCKLKLSTPRLVLRPVELKGQSFAFILRRSSHSSSFPSLQTPLECSLSRTNQRSTAHK